MVKYRIDRASGWGKGPVSEDKCIVQRKCGEFLGEGQVEIHPLRVWFRLRERGGTWVKASDLQWLRGCTARSYPSWGSVEGSGYCLVC